MQKLVWHRSSHLVDEAASICHGQYRPCYVASAKGLRYIIKDEEPGLFTLKIIGHRYSYLTAATLEDAQANAQRYADAQKPTPIRRALAALSQLFRYVSNR